MVAFMEICEDLMNSLTRFDNADVVPGGLFSRLHQLGYTESQIRAICLEINECCPLCSGPRPCLSCRDE